MPDEMVDHLVQRFYNRRVVDVLNGAHFLNHQLAMKGVAVLAIEKVKNISITQNCGTLLDQVMALQVEFLEMKLEMSNQMR